MLLGGLQYHNGTISGPAGVLVGFQISGRTLRGCRKESLNPKILLCKLSYGLHHGRLDFSKGQDNTQHFQVSGSRNRTLNGLGDQKP